MNLMEASLDGTTVEDTGDFAGCLAIVIGIPIRICENNGKLWLMEGPVVAQDEYMVIRSRVKYDEKGNIISANYSKIIGPGGFAGCANFMELVFNPRPNDTNLEFDPKQNLYHGKKGRGMIP